MLVKLWHWQQSIGWLLRSPRGCGRTRRESTLAAIRPHGWGRDVEAARNGTPGRGSDTPHASRRGLLGLGRATCRVSAGTTARLAWPGAQIRHLLWQSATWEHGTVLAKC